MEKKPTTSGRRKGGTGKGKGIVWVREGIIIWYWVGERTKVLRVSKRIETGDLGRKEVVRIL